MSAHGLKITNFHYGNMMMPQADPNLRDYPKWVYPDGPKSGVIVQNAEEEAALLASGAVPALAAESVAPVEPTITLSPDNDEKAVLLALAKERGIKVDARWGVEKIRAAMTAAQPSAG
jgi:hypothetical protein